MSAATELNALAYTWRNYVMCFIFVSFSISLQQEH